MTHPPHAKSVNPGYRLTGKPPAFDAGIVGPNPAALTKETDNISSFQTLTDEEAEEIKERLRIDRASIYA